MAVRHVSPTPTTVSQLRNLHLQSLLDPFATLLLFRFCCSLFTCPFSWPSCQNSNAHSVVALLALDRRGKQPAQTCPRIRKFYFKTPNRKFASCLHVAPASGHATKWQTNEIESLAKLRSPEKLANAVTTGWRRAPKGVGNELHPSRPEPVLSNAPAVVCSCYAQSVAKADSTLPPQGSKKAHEQHKQLQASSAKVNR